jgi:peptidoglycan/LPS O-acetylase OafA/YrhL
MERNTNTLYILRFLAALVVILFHYTPVGLGPGVAFIIKNGNEAVNFFFFISGFVLTISNGKFFNGDKAKFPKKEFYVKRIARIYPLYVLAILMLLSFHYGIKTIDTPTVIYRMPFEIAGVQRWLYAGSFNYPGWSISCEFMFYLLFPFIAQYLRVNRAGFAKLVWVYFFVALIATYALSILIKQNLPMLAGKLVVALYLNPILLISVFLFGVLAGKCFIENKLTFFKNPWNNVLSVVAAAAVIGLAKYYAPNGSVLLKGGALAPVYFVFITAITSFKTDSTRLFSSKLFIFLGEISYGMYIFQYPVYVFYTRYVTKMETGIDLLLFTLALIAFTSLTHILVEKPMRKVITTWGLTKRTVVING